MTNPLREAAEAGIVRAEWDAALDAARNDLIIQWALKHADTLLSELDTARKEVERLRGETFLASAEAAEHHRDNAIAMWDAEVKRANALDIALTEAKARIAELEGALEPFAAIGQYLIDEGFVTKPDTAEVWGFDGISLTYGDFRTAARTLSPDTTEGGK